MRNKNKIYLRRVIDYYFNPERDESIEEKPKLKEAKEFLSQKLDIPEMSVSILAILFNRQFLLEKITSFYTISIYIRIDDEVLLYKHKQAFEALIDKGLIEVDTPYDLANAKLTITDKILNELNIDLIKFKNSAMFILLFHPYLTEDDIAFFKSNIHNECLDLGELHRTAVVNGFYVLAEMIANQNIYNINRDEHMVEYLINCVSFELLDCIEYFFKDAKYFITQKTYDSLINHFKGRELSEEKEVIIKYIRQEFKRQKLERLLNKTSNN
ncbi:hypothetical protein [Parabacteroides sp. FAFU027]|uniref:hypothetical protein n=1 Tax=Parabacteroides sp. FAFU027 TaxID=2922715 RepID=UPI001FAF92DF|nr:hypothetical protein [Parabacteroides sp. FAFU027]